jgi:hypothetical protein
MKQAHSAVASARRAPPRRLFVLIIVIGRRWSRKKPLRLCLVGSQRQNDRGQIRSGAGDLCMYSRMPYQRHSDENLMILIKSRRVVWRSFAPQRLQVCHRSIFRNVGLRLRIQDN